MKVLRNLDININEDIFISGLTCSSRLIKKDQCFIALQGLRSHGLDYIDEAISNGASCVLHNKENYNKQHKIPCFFIEDLFEKQKKICLNFYNIREENLKFLIFTGTNGKTSTASFSYQILLKTNKDAVLAGTLGLESRTRFKETKNTTPNLFELFGFISKEKYEDDLFICIEASSHGLEQNRLIGIDAETRAILNIEQDHLDFHKNIQNYIGSKLKILDFSSHNKIILNGDCETCASLIDNELAEYEKCIVSNSNKKADYFFSIVKTNKNGCNFKLISNKRYIDLKVRFFQKHNIYNLVFAIACLDQIEKNIFFDKELIESIDLPSGRAKIISKNSKNILIDYAHNFAGIKAIVNSVSNIYHDLIIVYGCGGERDSSERGKIMKFSCTNSRKVIFTSDNCRNESFQTILDDSRKDQEYGNLIVEEDRKQAIKSGLEDLKKDEILLILGKGHEEFQEIKGTKIPFNDQKVVEEIL
tara:strand:- start:4358 stop:5782 length:1425 start_codon:yes stop_codon:yes gene_type:complete